MLAATFLRRNRRTAKVAGSGMASRIHPGCDGAEWIALQTRAVFGAGSTLLTDCDQVSESVAAAAPACRPGQPEPWRHTQQKRLKRGASAQVIAELVMHREAAAVSDEHAPVRAAHRDLGNRPESLDYPATLAAELPIGSRLIESGRKPVLQARLRIPGAAWLPSHAETMAQLRVLRSNDRWSELWSLAA